MKAPSPRSDEPQNTFGTDFRRFFLRGLSVIAPTIVSIAILVWAYNFIDRTLGSSVTTVLLNIMSAGDRKPDLVREEDALTYGQPIHEIDSEGRALTWEYKLLQSPAVSPTQKARVMWEIFFRKYHLNIVGFILAILLIYLAGYVLASFMGRATWGVVERAFFRLPVIKAVYPHVKQVTDLLLAEKKMDVSAVVAVQFPRPGIWAVGLVVGPGFPPMREKFTGDFLTVFIMSSPTPFTGYPIWVRRDEVVSLPMSLDEAVRYCVSCGVVAPGGRRVLQLRTDSPWQATGSAATPQDKTGQDGGAPGNSGH